MCLLSAPAAAAAVADSAAAAASDAVASAACAAVAAVAAAASVTIARWPQVVPACGYNMCSEQPNRYHCQYHWHHVQLV